MACLSAFGSYILSSANHCPVGPPFKLFLQLCALLQTGHTALSTKTGLRHVCVLVTAALRAVWEPAFLWGTLLVITHTHHSLISHLVPILGEVIVRACSASSAGLAPMISSRPRLSSHLTHRPVSRVKPPQKTVPTHPVLGPFCPHPVQWSCNPARPTFSSPFPPPSLPSLPCLDSCTHASLLTLNTVLVCQQSHQPETSPDLLIFVHTHVAQCGQKRKHRQ